MLTPHTCDIDRIMRPAHAQRRPSSAGRPRQHVDQLVHLAALFAAVTACDRMLDTVADMILQDLLLDAPQRGAYRRDLGEDVDAVAVMLDHAGDPAHLALDSAEATKTRSLGLFAHVAYIPPQ